MILLNPWIQCNITSVTLSVFLYLVSSISQERGGRCGTINRHFLIHSEVNLRGFIVLAYIDQKTPETSDFIYLSFTEMKRG